MSLLVHGQITLRRKSSPTDLTLEWFDTKMEIVVSLQVKRGTPTLPTSDSPSNVNEVVKNRTKNPFWSIHALPNHSFQFSTVK